MENKKACIIGGGGAAGLCAARRLQTINQAGITNIDIFMYEKGDRVGGTWIYNEPPADFKADQQTANWKWNVHSSMYNVLLTNLPKEVMNFHDLSFDKIIPKLNSSFISREHVLTYLEKYAEPVKHLIQFNSCVLNVELVEPCNNSTTKWRVTVSQVSGDSTQPSSLGPPYNQMFDYVFVCTGHFSTPLLPPFLSQLQLPVIHSHYYRRAEEYAGKNVCIIGASFSGTDICYQVAEFAKKVYLSHRTPSPDNSTFGVLPANCKEVESVINANANTLILANGVEITDLDAVISCTGYKYNLPFMGNLVSTPSDGAYVSPLLAHVAHRDHLDSLFFIGLLSSHIPFVAFDHQVLFATALMLHLVDKQELDTDKINQFEVNRLTQLKAAGKMPKHYHQLGPEQWSYYRYLYQLGAANNILPRFKQLAPVKQKIHAHAGKQRKLNARNYKYINYKIVDDENFEVFE